MSVFTDLDNTISRLIEGDATQWIIVIGEVLLMVFGAIMILRVWKKHKRILGIPLISFSENTLIIHGQNKEIEISKLKDVVLEFSNLKLTLESNEELLIPVDGVLLRGSFKPLLKHLEDKIKH